MTVLDVAPVADWTRRLVERGTGKQVGDREAPDGATMPYSVVHVIGSTFDGPWLSTPDADAALTVQVDSVGRRPDQVDWLSDRVRRTMLARGGDGSFQVQEPDPAPWRVADREPSGGPTPPVADGSSAHRVYTSSERFVLRVTPGDTP